MAKQTNSGWPEPNDWFNRLYSEMAVRQAAYEAERDPLIKRDAAAHILALVVTSLMEFPPILDSTVHLPLKDLLIFLNDLHKGRDHPWSAPRNYGGTNISSTAKVELKIWVRAAYAVLISSGFKQAEVCREIAKGLTDSGRRGRGNGGIRWQTVREWCKEPERSAERAIREKVERWWVEFRKSTSTIRVVHSDGSPATEKEIAALFVGKIWSLPHLRDRSISEGA